MPNSSDKGSTKALLSSSLIPRHCHVLAHCRTSSTVVCMLGPSWWYVIHLLLSPTKQSICFCPFSILLLRKKKPYTHITYGSCHVSCSLQLFQMQLHFLGTVYCVAETYQHPKVNIQDLGQWKSFSIPGFSTSHSRHDVWDLSIPRNLWSARVHAKPHSFHISTVWFWMSAVLQRKFVGYENHSRKRMPKTRAISTQDLLRIQSILISQNTRMYLT